MLFLNGLGPEVARVFKDTGYHPSPERYELLVWPKPALVATPALGELSPEERKRIVVADAPLVEGAVAAGVAASTGCSCEEAARAAEEARSVAKL